MTKKALRLTQAEIMLDLLDGMNSRFGWGGWYFTPQRLVGMGWTVRGDCERLDLHITFAPPFLLIQESADTQYHYEKFYREVGQLVKQAKESGK